MIDRIEELLAELAAEDEEEQEDILAQKRGAVVSSGPRSERNERGKAPEGQTAFAQSESLGRVANRQNVTTGETARPRSGLVAREAGDGGTGDRSGGRTAGDILLDQFGLIAGEAGDGGTGDRSGGRTARQIVLERSGPAAGETAVESTQAVGEFWKDGPVWTVQGARPEAGTAQRTGAAERTARAEDAVLPPQDGGPVWTGMERAVRDGAAGLALEGVRRSGPALAGLEGLYRQTVQGLRPAAPALPPEQAGRTAQAQEPGSAASLTVDELDRAVRRDSRRYDGGMSIY